MRRMRQAIERALLAGILVTSPAGLSAADGEKDLEGAVELTYRNVSRQGSAEKYDEDFDGLGSGVHLSNLELNWNSIDSDAIDYLRLQANGLGGEPFERTSVRLGRGGSYDLSITHRKQDHLYNLFEIVGDLDGFVQDSERRFTDIDLTLHATDKVDVFFGFEDAQRDGTSLFLKNVNTDLFRLETPLDQEVKRYSVGAKFAIGRADVVFRHTLRRHDYRFDSTTAGDAGLSPTDLVTLGEYDWMQTDSGGADLSTITVSLPFGDRVHVVATAFGTLIGNDESTSRVFLEASGTSFQGNCSVTGAFCDPGNPCATGVPGNVCVADAFSVSGGRSAADLEADHLLLDADVSVKVGEPLDFHVQVQSLSHDVTGSQLRDLDGDGIADDTEGTVNDSVPGSSTRVDRTLTSITGLFDYAPSSRVRLRAGLRTLDRELERSGFQYGTNEYRNTRFESDDDRTLILGLLVQPVAWLRLNADYEEGDITQAFTATSPMERDRLRVRLRLLARPEMHVDLGYLDYKNRNTGADFRQAASCDLPTGDIDDGCWNSHAEGTTYSASFRHEANPNLDYFFRWARQDASRQTRSRFDLDAFGFAENGESIHDATSDAWSGRVNLGWVAAWRGFVRFQINRSDGENGISGPTLASALLIEQDYSDVELGATYTFPSRLYVGGRVRLFDYEDVNDRLNYDGEMVSIVAGLVF